MAMPPDARGISWYQEIRPLVGQRYSVLKEHCPSLVARGGHGQDAHATFLKKKLGLPI
jgi:hypothetical protein